MYALYVSHGSYYSLWDAFDTYEDALTYAEQLAEKDGVAYYIMYEDMFNEEEDE